MLLLHRDGNIRLMQTLINEGNDVNCVDNEGRTPLMYW